MLSEQLTTPGIQTGTQPQISARWFDWGMVALSAWFLGGLYTDGWAHTHGLVDTTFFTPWHAIFYAGYGAVALLLALGVARGVLAGRPWFDALPRGYELALIGAPLFALGGVGDMIWHELFGIEEGVEALLSPTHLLLASSMALILSAPARAAWSRTELRRIPGSALLALAFTLSLITFMTQFGHPYVYLLARTRSDDEGQAIGVLALMLYAGIVSGTLLLALRRWALPFGAATLLLTLNAALMSVLEDRFWVIGTGLTAGLAIDLLVLALRPGPGRTWAMRLIAMLAPMLVALSYFIGIMQSGRMAWSIHLWLGSVVMAGIVGLGISLIGIAQE